MGRIPLGLETTIQISSKRSTQISSQHISGFKKLLLNQPGFLRAVGDEKSAVHAAGLPGRSALLPIPALLAGILEYQAVSKTLCPKLCVWWFENSQLSLLLQRKKNNKKNPSRARNCLLQQQDFLGWQWLHQTMPVRFSRMRKSPYNGPSPPIFTAGFAGRSLARKY